MGFVRWVAQKLESLGTVPVLGRALDFGCGHGRLTQALATYFPEVVGVDIAASMLAAARLANKHGDRVSYVQNVRPDLSMFADASFDFVLTALVLQHMRPEYAACYMREFLRVLRPGGVAFFQIPVEPLAPRPRDNARRTRGRALRPADLRAATGIVPSRLALVANGWSWLRVDVHNRGAEVLHGDDGLGVTVRLQRPDDVVVVAPVTVPLPYDVESGGSVGVLVAVQAPALQGTTWSTRCQLCAVPGSCIRATCRRSCPRTCPRRRRHRRLAPPIRTRRAGMAR